MPRVSVVMPTYNRAAFIGEALRSVYSQTFVDFEIVVVDDCSDDDTEAIVREESAGGRLTYYRNADRRGASVSRNIGVNIAVGEYVVYLDSDDLLSSQHLSRVVHVLDMQEEVGVLGCDSVVIDGKGRRVRGGRTWVEINSALKGYQIVSGYRTVSEIFLFSTCFPGMTIRRRVFETIGYLDQGMFPLDDVEFSMRAAAAGVGTYYLNEALAFYRDHGANESGGRNMVRTCTKKIDCLRAALVRYPQLRELGWRARRRMADAYLELAIALWRDGKAAGSAGSLGRAFVSHPGIVRNVVAVVQRRLRGWNSLSEPPLS